MSGGARWCDSIIRSATRCVNVPTLAVGNSARGGTHTRTKRCPREPQDRVSLPHPYFGHSLIFVQTNVLVDAHGRARVAGLGTALLPSAADRFFHGAAPELVDPQRLGLNETGTTKASDMYAFGVLAWEVGPISCVS